MTPTLGPTPTLPLGAFANYHSTALSAAALPEPTAQQVVTEEGLRHADNIVLDARHYKQASFAKDVVRLLATLSITTWTPPPVSQSIKIYKVSGSLTNAVFFISHPSAKTLLLRIYGPSSSSLVSRPRELHTLHILSSRYGIGPRVYGTFVNGRVEQHFESEALTPSEIRDPQVSAWIAMRMAELHCVDLETVDPGHGMERDGVRRNVRNWLGPAREVLCLAREKEYPGTNSLDLDEFARDWERYWTWLMRWEATHGRSRRVFAHNDAQYGNLLRLKKLRQGVPAHHRIIVVDFEYAAPNAAAFDIANHFHEWTADYHGARPHELRAEKYPDSQARRNFYLAYLTQIASAARPWPRAPTDDELGALDAAVRAWSAASHGMWGVWGIVQAREEIASGVRGEFDYVEYAKSRMSLFKKELKLLET